MEEVRHDVTLQQIKGELDENGQLLLDHFQADSDEEKPAHAQDAGGTPRR